MLWNTNTASCWTRRQTTAAVNSPRSSSHRSVLKTESDHRNLLLTLIVRCVYNTRGVTDAKVEQEAGQLLFAVAVFLLHLLSKLRFVWVRSAQVYKRVVLIQTRRFKARYTLATKLTELATVSTATSCRIQVVADLSPKPATKSTVSATVDFVASVYRGLNGYDFAGVPRRRLQWLALWMRCTLHAYTANSFSLVVTVWPIVVAVVATATAAAAAAAAAAVARVLEITVVYHTGEL